MSKKMLMPFVGGIMLLLILIGTVFAEYEGIYYEGTIDINVYKSSIPYTSHIQGFVEKKAGAHYYMQGPYVTKYTSAFGIADLTNIKLDLKNNTRVAYLSFGVGSNSWVDFGIRNVGSGWETYYYSHGDYNKWWEGNEHLADAKKVQMNVNAKIEDGKDKVTAYFEYYDGDDNVLKTTYKECVATKGKIFAVSGGKPLFRYYRFMSLVPTSYDDTDDGSYMKNAKLISLQLYNATKKKYQVWDINSELVEYAWTVQNKNITLKSSKTVDAVNINHTYNYN